MYIYIYLYLLYALRNIKKEDRKNRHVNVSKLQIKFSCKKNVFRNPRFLSLFDFQCETNKK